MQIQTWLVITIIVILSYILIEHTVYIFKYKNLKYKEKEEFTPYRSIFIYDKNTREQVRQLYSVAVKAHQDHGIKSMIHFNDKAGYEKIIYFNGNEIWFIDIDANFESLSYDLVHSYHNRVFVGQEMHEGALRACIEKLGLIDFAFTFGYCKKGEK